MQSQDSFPKIVRLSVGGVHFETSHETLARGDPESMLAVMFSGRHNVSKDQDGRYFIDRDGTHFRYILNYLRDGNTYIPLDNQQVIDELYEEVRFYHIDHLMQKLEQIRTTAQNKIDYPKLLQLLNSRCEKVLQLPNLKLNNMQLSFLDLSNSNLRNCDFSHVQAVEARFSFSNLGNCVFIEANFERASFRDAVLNNCRFDKTGLIQADLVRARGKDISFFRARMNECDFRDGDFIGANFTEADLSGALIDRANFTAAIQMQAALNFSLANNVNGEGRPRPVGDLLNVEIGVGGPGAIGAAGPLPNDNL